MPFFKKRVCAAALCFIILAFALSFSSCKKPTTAKADKVTITAEYSDGKLAGKAEYTLTNTGSVPFKDVRFNLYANAYKKSAKFSPVEEKKKTDVFKGGYGGITVEKASVNGKEATAQVGGEDENVLIVGCDEYFPDEKVKVTLEFTTTLPVADLRLGKTADTVNLADFYPVPCKIANGTRIECLYSPFGDPYYQGVCDYDVTLTVPSKFTVAAAGYPEKTNVDGGKTTYRYSLKNGRDIAFVLSEKFNVSSRRVGDVTVTAYALDENQDEIADVAARALGFFSSAYGKFAYKNMSVAVTPFSCGGMEYSSLAFIAKGLSKQETELAIIHEIAHEWWHCAVGNDQINEAYIDEGLAEFSVWLYLTENGRKAEADEMLNNAKSVYKAYFDIYKTLGGEANTKMQRSLNEFSSINEYVAVVYDKSLIMFATYANTVGLKKAKRQLKKLYAKHLYGDITLTDITGILGLKEHFVSFVDGKVLI